ncbi:hypothetical protein ACWERF_05680 [Streptomyces griseoluteus]
MTNHIHGRASRGVVVGALASALATGFIAVPEVVAPQAASAVACASNVSTYVLEKKPGAAVRAGSSFTLRKYLDWDPQGGDVNGPLFDTEKTASVASTSSLFTGGHGIIYEVTADGALKTYRDDTASGGKLLTPVRTYDVNWTARHSAWSDGAGLIFVNHDGGKLEIFKQGSPATGDGTLTLLTIVPSGNPQVEAFKSADSVWAYGGKVFTLTHGEIRSWAYSEAAGNVTVAATSTLVATGLTGAAQAWSPGPGTVYTASAPADTATGVVRSYTGSPLAPANDSVFEGLYGPVMTDAASCLAPVAEEKPHLGALPAEDPDVPEIGPEREPDPAGAGPKTVSGRFTLPNGQPAGGFPVSVKLSTDTSDSTGPVTEPTVGTVTTAADGTWSLTLPEILPAAAQQAADDNGGALNLSATVAGATSSGVPVVGVDNVVAAPASPATGQPTTFAAQAVAGEQQHSTALTPASAPDAPDPVEPTTSQLTSTYAAQREADASSDDEAVPPAWQSDRSSLSASFNPNVVNGQNIGGQLVSPFNPDCETVKYKLSSKIAYTTVGEAHAYWDTKATFDYDAKLSSTIDTGYSGGGTNWTLSGSRSVGGSIGHATGYSNKGPYFAKQWKVPIRYTKYKKVHYCNGVQRSKWYTIEAGRYDIPGGGSTGKYGKDVRSKDGTKIYDVPKSRTAVVPKGSYFQLSGGRSIKWTGAATVYGLTIGASTSYDRDHKQRITAGNGRYKHYIWGLHDKPSGNPGIFLSD